MGSVQTSTVFLSGFTILSVLIVWTLCCCSQGTLSYAAPTGAAAGDDARQGDAEVVGSRARVDYSTRKLLQEEENEFLENRKLDAECRNCNRLSEALFNATLEGDSEKVKELLSKGADVNETSSKEGESLLHIASFQDNNASDTVEILIAAGENVNAQNEDGKTPLHYAAQYGHLDVAKILVKEGANVDFKDENEGTPLIDASSFGRLELVEFLLESDHQAFQFVELYPHGFGADINAQTEINATGLHLAANRASTNIVNILIKAGANVDTQNYFGETPLHYATRGDLGPDVVKALIKAGASVDLREYFNTYTPLMVAAVEGKVKMVKELLESGANIEARSDTNDTPLSLAAEYGHLDVAKVLVEAGANVDAEDGFGNTPLIGAAEFGSTPLIGAAEFGGGALVEYLLESGVDINAQDNDGKTALMNVLDTDPINQAMVELLLDNGAEANVQDDDGNTALHLAAYYGHDESVELLMKAGADVDIKNDDGDKPVDVICKCKPDSYCGEEPCGKGEEKRLKAILGG